jgi:hypothetical protein
LAARQIHGRHLSASCGPDALPRARRRSSSSVIVVVAAEFFGEEERASEREREDLRILHKVF